MKTNNQINVTFQKVQTGIFAVLCNGEKTDWEVINGSMGLSGRNTINTYGVTNQKTEKIIWLGPLRTAKHAAIALVEKEMKLKGVK